MTESLARDIRTNVTRLAGCFVLALGRRGRSTERSARDKGIVCDKGIVWRLAGAGLAEGILLLTHRCVDLGPTCDLDLLGDHGTPREPLGQELS